MGEREKQIWDAKIKKVKFEAGDMLMLTHEDKYGLESRFEGPYIITKPFPDYGTFQLETVAGEKPSNPWYDPTASRRGVREHNKTVSTTPVSDDLRGMISVYKDQSPISSHPALEIKNPPPDWVDPPISQVPILSDRAVTPTSAIQLPVDPDMTMDSRALNDSDVIIIDEDPSFETPSELQLDAEMNTVTLESNSEAMEVADVNQSVSENILPSVSNKLLGLDEDMRLPDIDMSDNDSLSLGESDNALDERLSLPDSPPTPISVEPSKVPTGSFSFRADMPSFAPPSVSRAKAKSTIVPLKFKFPLVSPEPVSTASSSGEPGSDADV
ncbi:hypothetical protein EDC96DRAFT_582311 [Choanephora cucurbitarum]|nr:hypothetical protein EDC96DRAFT_582311 [Choanephora cucurbitarum]